MQTERWVAANPQTKPNQPIWAVSPLIGCCHPQTPIYMVNWEQAVSVDVFRESAIDHSLNNVRQKAEVGDRSV